MKWLVALLLLAANAQANSQLWLGGTRPYDTVPYQEMDIEMTSGFAPNGSAPGLRLGYGIVDPWMVLASGAYNSASSSWIGSLGSRYRFFDPGTLPVDLAVFYDAVLGAAEPLHQLGLILSKDAGDNNFSLNLEQRNFKDFTARAGYLSPFLTWTLRARLDIQYTGQGSWPLTPELVSQLPGDISLELGAKLPGNGQPPTWLLSLSYEIFPTP